MTCRQPTTSLLLGKCAKQRGLGNVRAHPFHLRYAIALRTAVCACVCRCCAANSTKFSPVRQCGHPTSRQAGDDDAVTRSGGVAQCPAMANNCVQISERQSVSDWHCRPCEPEHTERCAKHSHAAARTHTHAPALTHTHTHTDTHPSQIQMILCFIIIT